MRVGDPVRLRRDSMLRERLSPFADDVGRVVDTIQVDDDDGLRIVVAYADQLYGRMAPLSAEDFVVDLGPDADPFMLHLYAALAEKERALISTRTREALARAKAAGKVLGGNKGHKIDAAATALSVASRKALSAERKAEVLPIVRELQAAGAISLRAIAHGLNAQGLSTPRGGSWGPAQVQRVLNPSP